MSMFCNQCQEAAKGTGCEIIGVCGKDAVTSNLQDLLVFAVQGLSFYAVEARKKGIAITPQVNRAVYEGLFVTITNANFDDAAITARIDKTLSLRNELRAILTAQGCGCTNLPDAASWQPNSIADYAQKSLIVSLRQEVNEDIRSLKSLVLFGLKGLAAYLEHAANLNFNDDSINEFLQDALAFLLQSNLSADALVAKTMETGKFGVSVMALLDKANTSTYGNPEITKVNIGVGTRPGILVSGHDLKDLEELLEQSKDAGIDIYTHSEMLPAHYYPAFKKYKHFVGNYGNAWWKQKEEFASFNGPILFTTNCIVPPGETAEYRKKVFTTGASGFPGFPHIAERENGKAKDFSSIIAFAKNCAAPTAIEEGHLVGGFAHEQVFALAGAVVDAVKTGAIKKFFVMAGCDGRMKSRDYYSEFAEALPKDTVILTAGCAKYRYNKLPLGDINGIPRVLDAGQCNDSYSLALIALKLKEVFALNDINELPIAYNIAWYEQKAVIVLLALLYLGVKNIHLGPTLPAFLSPGVASVLVEKFGIAGIGTVSDDMKIFLGEQVA